MSFDGVKHGCAIGIRRIEIEPGTQRKNLSLRQLKREGALQIREPLAVQTDAAVAARIFRNVFA